jgi:hypothetical protein
MIAVFSITLSYRPFAGKVAAKKYGLILTREAILPIKRKRGSTQHLVTFGARHELIGNKTKPFVRNEIRGVQFAILIFCEAGRLRSRDNSEDSLWVRAARIATRPARD